MPSISQISDSVLKEYVVLPDGTLAEKVVFSNSDGTDIGGSSGALTGISQISDSVKKFYVAMTSGSYAERKVAVNPDGTPIGA